MFEIHTIYSNSKVEVIGIQEIEWADFYHTVFTFHRGLIGTIVMEKNKNYTFSKIFNAINQEIDSHMIYDEKTGWEMEREEFHYDSIRDYLNSDDFQRNVEKKFWPENFWGN